MLIIYIIRNNNLLTPDCEKYGKRKFNTFKVPVFNKYTYLQTIIRLDYLSIKSIIINVIGKMINVTSNCSGFHPALGYTLKLSVQSTRYNV